jgi:transmembrane sensor
MNAMAGARAASTEPDSETLEAAAHWFAVLSDVAPDAAAQQDWRAWLAASPQHRQAWARVEAISQGMSLPREQPLAAAFALDAASRLQKRRRALKMLTVLAGSGLGAWGMSRTPAGQSLLAGLGADFQTGVGEVREIALQDHSQLWLNTDTAIDARFDPARRLVLLRKGEIMIATHPDTQAPARPFLVDSAQGRMRALGTRFSVRALDADTTELSVFEGRVEVMPARSNAARIVETGERVRVTPTAIVAHGSADPGQMMWSRGILLADGTPLGEVVAQLARYRRGHLGCDPAVAHLRVVGGYPLTDADRALQLLQASLPIEVHAITPWWLTVGPRSK